MFRYEIRYRVRYFVTKYLYEVQVQVRKGASTAAGTIRRVPGYRYRCRHKVQVHIGTSTGSR